MVNGYKVDHAARATVVLGVSMSGVKLPAFVIFKGVWQGRIWQEVRGPHFPREFVRYSVQPKAWQDITTYKDWVSQVVAPYFDRCPGIVLQDNFSVHLNNTAIWSLNNVRVQAEFLPAGYLTKVSLSHLRTTTTSFRTTGLSCMQRAKNQLVLMSQLGLTQLGIPSLLRALPTRGNPLTFYHILIVDRYFTAVDIDGTKNKSQRRPGVVVGCQRFACF